MVVFFFAVEIIVFFVIVLLLYLWSCLEAPLYTSIFIIVEHIFKKHFRLFPAQDVHFFYTRAHLSALQNCALIL